MTAKTFQTVWDTARAAPKGKCRSIKADIGKEKSPKSMTYIPPNTAREGRAP